MTLPIFIWITYQPNFRLNYQLVLDYFGLSPLLDQEIILARRLGVVTSQSWSCTEIKRQLEIFGEDDQDAQRNDWLKIDEESHRSLCKHLLHRHMYLKIFNTSNKNHPTSIKESIKFGRRSFGLDLCLGFELLIQIRLDFPKFSISLWKYKLSSQACKLFTFFKPLVDFHWEVYCWVPVIKQERHPRM